MTFSRLLKKADGIGTFPPAALTRCEILQISQLKQGPPELSLVYHMGGLGDFIAALPAIGEWNRHNAGRRRILLGKPDTGALSVLQGFFDEVWDSERAEFSRLFSEETALSPVLEARIAGVCSAFVFARPDAPLAIRLAKRGLSRLIVHAPFPTHRIHICDYHLSCVAPALASARATAPRLVCGPAGAQEARALVCDLGNYAVIHPGSGSAAKNWPIDRFVKLSFMLKERGLDILWITGPAEDCAAPGAGQGRTAHSPSLSALVHVCASCKLYVGNDSGVSHLAAAAGAPTVVLFGPSNPKVWLPRGKNVRVVAAKHEWCSSCHGSRDVFKISCERSCIERIGISEVFDACASALGKH